MNQLKNGGKELSIENKLNDVETTIAAYLDSIKLNKVRLDPEVEEILSKNYNEIKALTPELCGNYSFILARYALYIQQESNKHTRVFNWCESNINLIIAKKAHNYNGLTFEERKAAVVWEDELAKQLYQCKLQSKSLLDSISFLAEKIRYMSQVLLSIQNIKRQKHD